MKYYTIYFAWNTLKYKRPDGKQSSSVNHGNGFGFEEWNACEDNVVEFNGVKKRLFYAFPKSVEDNDVTFIFRSSKGRDKLLGYAKFCCQVTSSSDKKKLLAQLDLNKRYFECCDALKNNKHKDKGFKQSWMHDAKCFANWICDEDNFVWLNEPINIKSEDFTGKSKLSSHYGTTQEVKDWMGEWAISLIDENFDIQKIISEHKKNRKQKSKKTTQVSLIAARRGQGQFRQDLLDKWNYACSVTGFSLQELLRASHILPWKKADDDQRLDCENGLLLTANLDALFDKALISFDDDGRIVISENISSENIDRLGLNDLKMREKPSKKMKTYLKYHRALLKAQKAKKN